MPSKLSVPLVVVGEHALDYIQFTLGTLSWTSRTSTPPYNCKNGGWNPRDGPVCDQRVGDQNAVSVLCLSLSAAFSSPFEFCISRLFPLVRTSVVSPSFLVLTGANPDGFSSNHIPFLSLPHSFLTNISIVFARSLVQTPGNPLIH